MRAQNAAYALQRDSPKRVMLPTERCRTGSFQAVFAFVFYLPLALFFDYHIYITHMELNLVWQVRNVIRSRCLLRLRPFIHGSWSRICCCRVHATAVLGAQSAREENPLADRVCVHHTEPSPGPPCMQSLLYRQVSDRLPESDVLYMEIKPVCFVRVYVNRNFGGMLIIWDRLFGTFAEEIDEPVYGDTHPLRSWNPLWHITHHFIQLTQRMYRFPHETLWMKMKVLFKGLTLLHQPALVNLELP